MPNIESALRRVKRSEAQASVNKIRKSKYKAAVKQITSFITAGKTKEAKNFLPKFYSQLMKVAKTGVISKKEHHEKFLGLQKKFKV